MMLSAPNFLMHEVAMQTLYRAQRVLDDLKRLELLLEREIADAQSSNPRGIRWHKRSPMHSSLIAGLRAMQAAITDTSTSCSKLLSQPNVELDELYVFSAFLLQYERHAVQVAEWMHQRSSLMDAPEWHGSEEMTDSSAEIQQFHRAVEAVILDFTLGVLGERVAGGFQRARKPWLPIAVILDEYRIHHVPHGAAVLTLPRPDLFRSRIWPTIAHEIGHYLLHVTGPESHYANFFAKELDLEGIDAARTKLAKEILTLISVEILGSRRSLPSDDLESGKHRAWADELLCDAIAISLCGPAFLLSQACSLGPTLTQPMLLAPECDLILKAVADMDAEKLALQQWRTLQSTHPPSCARLIIGAELLHLQGFDSSFADHVGVRGLVQCWSDRGPCFDRELVREFTSAWIAGAPRIARSLQEICRLLLPAQHTEFGPAQWESAGDMCRGIPPHQTPSPRITLNAGWRKRHIAFTKFTGDSSPVSTRSFVFDAVRTPASMYGEVVGMLNRYLDEQVGIVEAWK